MSDFDQILTTNLHRVFNERDEAKRANAAAALFHDNAIMYEPEGIVEGRDAIVRVAGELLTRFGPKFYFMPQGVGVGHHGIGTLRWFGGESASAITVRGFDTARVVDGKISELWVLIEPPAK